MFSYRRLELNHFHRSGHMKRIRKICTFRHFVQPDGPRQVSQLQPLHPSSLRSDRMQNRNWDYNAGHAEVVRLEDNVQGRNVR